MAAVRECVSRFTIAATAQRDLLGLGQAYLAAEQWALADEALGKLATSVARSAVGTKAWTLYQIISVYLEAAPPQLAKAEQYLVRLDSLGAAGAGARIMAHVDMAREAYRRDSVPLHDREANAALKASRELMGDDRKEYTFHSASVYYQLALHRARKNDGPGAIAMINEARDVLVPLRSNVSMMLETSEFIPVGQKAPQLQATQWHNTGASGTTRPAPGRPSLIVFVPSPCIGFQEGYAMLRRLASKYESLGLDITLVTKNLGHVGSRVVQPEAEATYIRQCAFERWKLPGALSITLRVFERRSDGALFSNASMNEQAYQPMSVTLPTFLVDSQGKVRTHTALTRDNEAMIDRLIKELLDDRTPRP